MISAETRRTLYEQLELKQHQIGPLQKLRNGKVLYGGTGSGKSRVAVAYYIENEAPKDVYVITTARKRDDKDWEEEFLRVNVGPKGGVSGPGFAGLDQNVVRRMSAPKRSDTGRIPGHGPGVAVLSRGGTYQRSASNIDCRPGISTSPGTEGGTKGPGPGVPEELLCEGDHQGRDGFPDSSTGADGSGLADRAGGTHASRGASGGDAGEGGEAANKGCVSTAGGNRGRSGSHSEAEKGTPGTTGGGSAGRESPEGSTSKSSPRRTAGGAERSSDRDASSISVEPGSLDSGCLQGSSGLSPRGGAAAGYDRAPDGGASEGAAHPHGRSSAANDGVGRDGSGIRSFDSGQYPWVLTVDSWNNLAKYADIAGAFFIFDEQRLVGSGEWSRKFLRIAKHNNWILLSATPGDTWMDYIPLFVANNFYKNRTAFKREHVVYNTFSKFPKVDRYIGQGKLLRHRAELLIEMPVERHTTQIPIAVEVEYDEELMERVVKDRWHIYENRPLRDVSELFSVARKLVNSDPSRLSAVRGLMELHPRLIIFYNFDYELEILRTLRYPGFPGSSPISLARGNDSRVSTTTSRVSSTTTSESRLSSASMKLASTTVTKTPTSWGNLTWSSPTKATWSGIPTSSPSNPDNTPNSSTLTLAEWNGHKHQAVPTTERWVYLAQYTAAAEAWNCITTDVQIEYSQNYSWKVVKQSRGRIDRLNSPFKLLRYYGLVTDSWIDKAIARSLRAKETFNEKAYRGMFE